MEVIESGMIKFPLSPKQPEKAPAPIESIELGSTKELKLEQLQNASGPIDLTEEGINKDPKSFEQPQKAFEPIVSTISGRFNSSESLEQPQKDRDSIDVTDFGNFNDVKPEHPSNEPE